MESDLIKRFEMIKSCNGEFIKIFGTGLKQFHHMLFGFDAIKFDDWLKSRFGDYEDGETSMEDLIWEKFGGRAVAMIERLIGM